MAEGMAARVGRLISGGLNALVESAENAAPEMVMEEAIREIDSAIDDVRHDLGQVLAKKHLATERLAAENRRHDELAQQIELALNESRDDLAEAAVARQLDIEAQIPILERTVADCSDEEQELEGFVGALKAKRREMEDDLARFVQAQRDAPRAGTGGPGDGAPTADVGARIDNAASAFDRVMSRHTGLPGDATTPEDRKKLAELDEIARQNRVRERLAAAKARMGRT